MKKTDFVTTAEASEELSARTGGSVSIRRVQQILNAGGFDGAIKIGRDWLIPRAALASVVVYGKPGRKWPKKKKGAEPAR